jgi:tetratricopeptide (TPR) repeat protein
MTPSPATPYEQGVAHMKRGEYALAITAFTEAIRLEPDAPNGFAGRSLAYTLLGDEAAALQDKEAAKELGGPERSAWDRLVNRANRRWRGDLSNLEWRQVDPLTYKATLLRVWVGQIFNGGLPQWVANGYGQWIDDLARAADEVGTPATRAVAAVIREVASVLVKWPRARESMFGMIASQAELTKNEHELFEALARCEGNYDRVGQSFSANVEEWFEGQAKRVGKE